MAVNGTAEHSCISLYSIVLQVGPNHCWCWCTAVCVSLCLQCVDVKVTRIATSSLVLQLQSNLTCHNSYNSVCRGVHGVLLELLSCKSNLHTAVEVTGGNQLFHIVVDNDTVATKIVEVLTRDKMGRATFLPLNRINPSDVNYPEHHGSDAVPMLKLLKFSSKFAPAMKQVSGLINCPQLPPTALRVL